MQESATKYMKKEQKKYGKIRTYSDIISFSEKLSRTHNKDVLKLIIDDLKSQPTAWNFTVNSILTIVTLFTTILFGAFAVALGFYYNLSLEIIKMGVESSSDNLLSILFIGISVIVAVLGIFIGIITEKIKQANYYLSICELAIEKNLGTTNSAASQIAVSNLQTIEETNNA